MSASLSNNLDALFSKMENFISTKTVVGEAVHIGDVIIVPLVDVVFGLGAGGSQSDEKDKKIKEDSGGGLGGKITPSAVLVIVNGSVQMVNIKNQDSINKLLDMVPGLFSKFNLGAMFGKGKAEEAEDIEEIISGAMPPEKAVDMESGENIGH